MDESAHDTAILSRFSSDEQPNFLFRNNGAGQFEDVSGESGAHFLTRRSSRGAAFGDYDNDGDVDILVSNSNDSPRTTEKRRTASIRLKTVAFAPIPSARLFAASGVVMAIVALVPLI